MLVYSASACQFKDTGTFKDTVYIQVKTFFILTLSKIYPMYTLVAHFTWKYVLTSAENYLFMIDIIMNTKYISQILVGKNMQFWRKNCIQKCYLVNITKTPNILTCDLQFTNPIHVLQPLSYGVIQQKQLIQTI